MQVLSDVQEIIIGSPQETANLTINDLPTDALATILGKILHPKFPGAIWGRNLNPAVHEARWFLMDGRNQSHRVLDKFPQDACIASAQTCHIMRAALVCKRWKRIIYGEEGPGVVEHVAVTGNRMATKLPKTVKTLFIHGQNTDPMWRLVSKGGMVHVALALQAFSFVSVLFPRYRLLQSMRIDQPTELYSSLGVRVYRSIHLVRCTCNEPVGAFPLQCTLTH
jgi:hypothetical protein